MLAIGLQVVIFQLISSIMHAYRTNSRIPWGRIIPLRGQLEYSIAGNKDMIKISDFLSRNLFGENLSKSQYDEISRLLQQDLLSRYGELVGKRKFNAALLFVKDKNEIIGCAGIDTQVLQLYIYNLFD